MCYGEYTVVARQRFEVPELKSAATDYLALTILRASSAYVDRAEGIQTVSRELSRLPYIQAASVFVLDQWYHLAPLERSPGSELIVECLADMPLENLKVLFNDDLRDRLDFRTVKSLTLSNITATRATPGTKGTILACPMFQEADKTVYVLMMSRSPSAVVSPSMERVRFIFEISRRVLLTHLPLSEDNVLRVDERTSRVDLSFRRIFEDLEVPALLLNDSLQILEANKAFLKLHDSEHGELVGTSLFDLEFPLDSSQQWLLDAASTVRPLKENLAQNVKLLAPRRSPPKVVITHLKALNPSVVDGEFWVAVLQNFDEEFENLRQSSQYSETLRNALGEAPIQIFLATPSGTVLEMEGALQGFSETLASLPSQNVNLKAALESLGITKDTWSNVLQGVPQSFSVERQSRHFRVWLSLVPGHASSKSFHVAGVVADVTSTKMAQAILHIRERAAHEVRVLSENALKDLQERQWQVEVAKAQSHIQELIDSVRNKHSHDTILLAELDNVLEDFISHISQVTEVRRRALESKVDLETLTYVHPTVGIFNRRCLLECVERQGFDKLGVDLDFTLIVLSNIEQLRDVLGVQRKDQLLLSVLTKAMNFLGEQFRIHMLSPTELMIVAATEKGNNKKIAEALRLLELPIRLPDALAVIKCQSSTLQTKDFIPIEFSKLYNRLVEALYNDVSLSPTDKQTAEKPTSTKCISAMRTLSEAIVSKTLMHRAEIAFDFNTNRIVMIEIKTPIRELARLTDGDPSPMAPLLSSGLFRSIEKAEFEALSRLTQSLRSHGDLWLCVNIAPPSLLEGTLQTALVEARSGMTRDFNFVFDISERYLMSYDLDQISRAVHRHKRLGINVALDEVGRGFSSFQLLQQVRFSHLKISKELYKTQLEQSHGRELASHLASLSKEIGIVPIATGVSCLEDSEELKRIGLSIQQGSYITGLLFGRKAVEVNELPVLLKDWFTDYLDFD